MIESALGFILRALTWPAGDLTHQEIKATMYFVNQSAFDNPQMWLRAEGGDPDPSKAMLSTNGKVLLWLPPVMQEVSDLVGV